MYVYMNTYDVNDTIVSFNYIHVISMCVKYKNIVYPNIFEEIGCANGNMYDTFLIL